MSIDYTSTALIASVRRRALIPRSQQLYDDADIAAILTEELDADIVPLIMEVREEFFVTNYDQAIVVTQQNYRLPQRAIGQKLRDVCLLNSNGLEVSYPRGDADYLKHQWFTGQYNRRVWIFRDDEVLCYPNAASLGAFQLRMKYFRRPNNIVLTTAAGQITGMDSNAKTLTLGNVPLSWSSLTSCDIIKGTPSFRSHGDDVAIASVDTASKVITLTSSIPSGVAIGDWVAEPGSSPIAQIPYETQQLLAQRTAVKILEGLGDREGLTSAADVYKDMLDKFRNLLTPRSDGSPKRIVRSNPLFGTSNRRRGWW